MTQIRRSPLRASMTIIALAFASSAHAQTCDVTLRDANVWTGSGFAKQTLAMRDGRFVIPDATKSSVDASYLFLIPPFADGHSHKYDSTTKSDDPAHNQAIAQGVFYALNPNNIRTPGPTPAASAGAVEVQAAGGGVTRPGGHPQPLYEYLARQPWFGMSAKDLPGKAFHLVTTPDEARKAVRLVKANGAAVIKLYLLNHDKGDLSEGLSAENFLAAVKEAKAQKLRPLVHIESAADFRLAVKAGIYAIVHSPYAAPTDKLPAENFMLTAEDAAAAAKAGIIVVPTVTVPLLNNDGAKLAAVQAIQRHNLTLLRDAKVKMAVGADNYARGLHDEVTTLRSFALFEGAEILNMATINGAELAFPERKIGKFTPGYEASFVGYYFNPIGLWGSLNEPVVGVRAGVTMIDQRGVLAKMCLKPSATAK